MEMPLAADQQEEFCKVCQQSFPNWDAFLLHKIQNKKHISCLFCGQDFKTFDGRSRHQHQYHATEQSLKCAGCDLAFVRAGSYISHIEQKQCPVIHKSLFEARRAQREKAIKEKNVGNSIPPYPPTDASSICDSFLAFHDNGPTQTSWDKWDEDDASAQLSECDFPALPMQVFKNGGSNIPDILAGRPEKLNQENLAWYLKKDLFPYLPDKPTDAPKKPLAAVSINPVTKKEGLHPFDPDNPEFDFRQYYNPVNDKFRCPWPGCKKLQNHRLGLIQHLKSPAHMDAKLRCPACLRQYQSATALVQHAESQAIKCQIRESVEYKTAVDQITGGFVDTAGRHKDDTIRYTAPTTYFGGEATEGFEAQVANANANYWAKAEKKREETIKAMAEENSW